MTDPAAFSTLFKTEWPKVVGALVRQFGDLDLAEEATQDAFLAATTAWADDAWPASPGGWLMTTARNRAIDRQRRQKRLDARIPELGRMASAEGAPSASGFPDDRLALILGCCHPALAPEGQVALTLRSVCGLSTAQIARAFLVSESTMTRRISRAKQKISGANIVFDVNRDRLAQRLPPVCGVVYSIYTEGHTSSTDAALVRGDLCEEALWLSGLLADLVPDDAEVLGLLAFLLLTDARRSARTAADGSVVLLADQPRDQWDRQKIAQGLAVLGAAHARQDPGAYQLQASIAALHSTAPRFDKTDWAGIVRLYDALLSYSDDAVTALNRSAAIGHGQGPREGLSALARLSADHLERLADYPYLHACRGEFHAALGHAAEARTAFVRARSLTRNDAERAHLSDRLDALGE